MSRLEFSNPTKRAAHKRSGGICECHRVECLNRPQGCGDKLGEGNTLYEHIEPDAMHPDNSLANCAVLVLACWRGKTRLIPQPAHANTKPGAGRPHGTK